jgi:hypothetical protein
MSGGGGQCLEYQLIFVLLSLIFVLVCGYFFIVFENANHQN